MVSESVQLEEINPSELCSSVLLSVVSSPCSGGTVLVVALNHHEELGSLLNPNWDMLFCLSV